MALSVNRQQFFLFLALPVALLAAYLLLENFLLLAAILVAPIVLIIAFFYPVVLLGFLIISTVLQEVMFVSIAEVATANQMIGTALLIIVFIKALIKKEFKMLANPVSFALTALLGVLICSFLLFSVGRENPLQDINQFYRSLIYFFICLLVIRTPRDLLVITFSYIIAGVIIAVTGFFWNAIVFPITYFAQGKEGRQGILGITGHYIEYAFRCMITLPVIAYALLSKKVFAKPLYVIFLGSLVALTAAVLLSGSRGAIIAYFFMFSVVAIMAKISLPRKIILVALLSLIPAFLPIGDLLNNVASLIRGDVPYGDASSSMRATHIHNAVSDIKNFSLGSFLWGKGLENFRDYFSGTYNPPHSMWLQSLYELGIIGLGIQLYILYKIFQVFFNLHKNKSISLEKTLTLGWGVSIFVMLFWGLYENYGLINGNKHLFIALGIFMAGSRIAMAERY